MHLQVSAILFDLGHTLLYTPRAMSWAQALDRMRAELLAHLRAAGYDLDLGEFTARFAARLREYDAQRQMDWVEHTAAHTLRATLEELGQPAPAPQALAGALRAYYRYSESLWQPVPGLHLTLERLRAAGYRLGLISNAADAENVRRLLTHARLDGYFDPVLISAAVGIRKPNPAIFRLALEAWGLPPEACLMVGDTLGADILGAQLAGLRHVWVTGHADHPANAAHRGNIVPEAEIDGIAELPEWLAGGGA